MPKKARYYNHDTSHYLYNTYKSMFMRVYNKNHVQYKNYGGRGLLISEEWHNFETFVLDMGERPNGYTLERRDVNGDYEKDNCYWCDISTQRANVRRRKNKIGHFKGVFRAPRTGNWFVQITVNGRSKNYGTYKCQIKAASVYDKVINEYYGEGVVSTNESLGLYESFKK